MNQYDPSLNMTNRESILRNLLSGIGFGVETKDERSKKKTDSIAQAAAALFGDAQGPAAEPRPMSEAEEMGELPAPGVEEQPDSRDSMFKRQGQDFLSSIDSLRQTDPLQYRKYASQLMQQAIPGNVSELGMHDDKMDLQRQNLQFKRDNMAMQKMRDKWTKEGLDEEAQRDAFANAGVVDKYKLAKLYPTIAGMDADADTKNAAMVQAYFTGLEADEKEAASNHMASEQLLWASQRAEIQDSQRLRKAQRRMDMMVNGVPEDQATAARGAEAWEKVDTAFDFIESNKSTVDEAIASIDDILGNDKRTGWISPKNEMGNKMRESLLGGSFGKVVVQDLFGPGELIDDSKAVLFVSELGNLFETNEAFSELRGLQKVLNALVVPRIKNTIGDARFTEKEARLVLQSVARLFSGDLASEEEINQEFENIASYMYEGMSKAFDYAQHHTKYQTDVGGLDKRGNSRLVGLNIPKPRLFNTHNNYSRLRDLNSRTVGGLRGYAKSQAAGITP